MLDDPRKKLILIEAAGISVCTVLTLIFVFGAIWPIATQRREAAERWVALSQQRAEARDLDTEVHQTKASVEALEQNMARNKVSLLPAEHLNDRMAGITAFCKECNLDIQSIAPATPVHGSKYDTVGIRLSARADYRNCLKFLHGVHEKFVDTGVVGFQLSGNTNDMTAPLSAQFDLTWYATAATVAQTE